MGGICRFLLSDRLNAMQWHCFPLGTFSVNAVGSLLLGVVFTQAWIAEGPLPGKFSLKLVSSVLLPHFLALVWRLTIFYIAVALAGH